MMTVTLLVISSLIFTSAMLTTTLDFVKSKVDINVYFVPTAAEEDILAFKKSIDVLPEVAATEYISREQALAAFRERHENDQVTLQALEELGENPLEASVSVRAKDPAQYETIANRLSADTALGQSAATIIDRVDYTRNKVAIDNLTKLITAVQTFGYALTAIFVVSSLLITFTTIRLAIYISRDEISVMKLVGGSNMYIRGPFIFVGFMYGAIAALLTLVLLYPLTYWLGPITENFFSGVNLFRYYLSNFFELFLILFLSGIVLGVLASFFAVRRHLRI